MASFKVLLCALLGLCLVTMSLGAAVEYQEPDIEANTNWAARAKKEGGAGGDDEDKEEEDSGKKDMEGDAELEENSGDMKYEEIGEVDILKKIDAVEEEKLDEKDGSSSSSEEDGEGSSSSEEEPGMLTKCSSGFEGMTALLNAVNGTGSKDCSMTKVLQSMLELLRTLSSDVSELKGQVAKNCSGGGAGDSKEEDSDESEEEEEGSEKKEITAKSSEEDEGSGDEEKEVEDDSSKGDNKRKKCDDDEESTTDAVMETTTKTAAPIIPPPPTSCPPPFQLLASSCYYIQSDPREWRSWGEAHSFCQQQGGILAAPYRAQELRDYLKLSYSNSFWVGARLLDGEWQWMTGSPLVEEDWRQGRPHKHPSQRCVYIDSFFGYKGSNYFCGEKFSFICEHIGV